MLTFKILLSLPQRTVFDVLISFKKLTDYFPTPLAQWVAAGNCMRFFLHVSSGCCKPGWLLCLLTDDWMLWHCMQHQQLSRRECTSTSRAVRIVRGRPEFRWCPTLRTWRGGSSISSSETPRFSSAFPSVSRLHVPKICWHVWFKRETEEIHPQRIEELVSRMSKNMPVYICLWLCN